MELLLASAVSWPEAFQNVSYGIIAMLGGMGFLYFIYKCGVDFD